MNDIIPKENVTKLVTTFKCKSESFCNCSKDFIERLYCETIFEIETVIKTNSIYSVLDYLIEIEIMFRDLYKVHNSSFLYDIFPETILLKPTSPKSKKQSLKNIFLFYLERINEYISSIKQFLEFKIIHKIQSQNQFISEYVFAGKINAFLEIFQSVFYSGLFIKSSGEKLKKKEFFDFLMLIFNFNIPDIDNRLSQLSSRSYSYHPYLNQLISSYELNIQKNAKK